MIVDPAVRARENLAEMERQYPSLSGKWRRVCLNNMTQCRMYLRTVTGEGGVTIVEYGNSVYGHEARKYLEENMGRSVAWIEERCPGVWVDEPTIRRTESGWGWIGRRREEA